MSGGWSAAIDALCEAAWRPGQRAAVYGFGRETNPFARATPGRKAWATGHASIARKLAA